MFLRRLAAVIAVIAVGWLTPAIAQADTAPDVYATPGVHLVNGRYWQTTCSHYSGTVVRCTVPRQVVGRISSLSKLGMVGSARPRWTSRGRFQAIASWGRTSLYSVR